MSHTGIGSGSIPMSCQHLINMILLIHLKGINPLQCHIELRLHKSHITSIATDLQ